MSDKPTVEELDPEQQTRIQRAPLPTPATLRHRRNKIYQLGKFIVMNLRIMDIVLREKLAK